MRAVIEKYTTYELPNKHRLPNPAWGVKKLARVYNDYLAIPAGLTGRVYNILQALARKYPDIVAGVTLETREEPLVLVHEPAGREYQNEAIKALAAARGGVLSIPTGGGKTFTAIEFVRCTDFKKVTVIVHTTDLKRQWEEAIAQKGLSDVKFYVTTYQSALALSLCYLADVLIFDECHHVAAKTIYSLAMKGGARANNRRTIVGLSATPWREDNADLLLESSLGPIVYEIERRRLIDEGYLVDAKVVYQRPLFEKHFPFQDYKEAYNQHIVQNEHRNQLIVNTACECVKRDRKVLILVSRMEHGRRLCEMLEQEHEWPVFLHGKIVDRKIDFSTTKIIIGTQIFNEGVDFPELDTLIIAGGGKSSIRVVQQVGRVLRTKNGKTKAEIYDFVDTPRHLKQHYKVRRELMEAEFEVVEW